MPHISSLQNPRVKLAVRLRERKHREREGLMLVEGRAELGLALTAGARPQTVFVCPDLHGPASALDLPPGTEVLAVTPTVFEKMAYREHPDGWLGLLPMPQAALAGLRLPPIPLVIVAEAVEKPGNLGAILRTADAAGAHALIVCDPATDLYNPNVVRASKGALFTLPVAQAATDETLAWLREHGLTLLAAAPEGEHDYTSVNLTGPLAIAVGAEDAGLSPAWLAAADLRVRIPMAGRVNSLNVSAAAAVLMYEVVRQRG